MLRFYNTVYLDNKKLNQKISEEIFNICNKIYLTNDLIELSLPDGLNNINIDIPKEPIIPND